MSLAPPLLSPTIPTLSFLTPSHPASSRSSSRKQKPKLSLQITSETTRTFNTKSTFATTRCPHTAVAMSPTSRNTIFNARSLNDINTSPSPSSSSSSESEEEEPPERRRKLNPRLVTGNKMCHRPSTSAATFLPIRERSKERKRQRRVRFSEAPVEVIIRPDDDEFEENAELSMPAAESDTLGGAKRKEGEKGLWRLGRKEYESLQQEEEEGIS